MQLSIQKEAIQFQKTNQDRVVKIGHTWFLQDIVPLVKPHEKIMFLLRCRGDFLLSEAFRDNSALQYQGLTREIRKQIVRCLIKTQTGLAHGIPPQNLQPEVFTNLISVCLTNMALTNIQNLAFINLLKVKKLSLGQTNRKSYCPKEWFNRLRSIQPLVKCVMPQLYELDLECGSVKSMGKAVSRIKTSQAIWEVYLQKYFVFWNYSYELRDEDLSIWAKAEAQKIGQIKFFTTEQSMRIGQIKVKNCLKRKHQEFTLTD